MSAPFNLTLHTRAGGRLVVREGTGPMVSVEIEFGGRSLALFLSPGEAEALGTGLERVARLVRSK